MIISPFSEIFMILFGEHAGRTCVIRDFGCSPKGQVQIVFADNDKDEFAFVKMEDLSLLELPGWPDTIYYHSYGLKEHFESKKGIGANMLRIPYAVQPRTLRPNDVLATNEVVVDVPRRGYNSSCLIRLNLTGWVELAPRLPIALKGNENWRFPSKLIRGEKLMTGCIVVRNPEIKELNWINIYLDRESCCINVPLCIPLALA